MSRLTDAAYDATAATRAACQAVGDRPHPSSDYAPALHQLHETASAMTTLLGQLRRRVSLADRTSMPAAVADVLDVFLADDLRAAETAARRLSIELNTCAQDFDQIQVTTPHNTAVAL
ncbi:MAG TPA: hypothetical protein VFW65_35205 [Pseudonocardiaceae bacterium]|nr:hypothetical protein [Pseudonocardiaceae bacterium]